MYIIESSKGTDSIYFLTHIIDFLNGSLDIKAKTVDLSGLSLAPRHNFVCIYHFYIFDIFFSSSPFYSSSSSHLDYTSQLASPRVATYHQTKMPNLCPEDRCTPAPHQPTDQTRPLQVYRPELVTGNVNQLSVVFSVTPRILDIVQAHTNLPS